MLGKYKEMKASANALLAEEKEKNLKLKEEILAKLEELTNSTDGSDGLNSPRGADAERP